MRFISFVLLLIAAPVAAEPDCHGQMPCRLGDRSYHVLEPDGWDGVTPLPVLAHFHGWQRQGTLIVQHRRIASATRRRGVLLVAPNGERRTWDFWTENTADRSFAEAVLADVAARWPVDEARIYVSGYSWGSNMAWRFVCHDGEGIAALLAISGTLDQNEDCDTAPGEVRQVYGLADRVLDFPYGPDGDTTWPVKLWRDSYGCGEGTPEGPWQAREFLTFERMTWDCPGGAVSLDIHPGGHFIPHGWIARQLDEMLGLEPSYP